MGYDVMEKAYGALTEAQQLIVDDLALLDDDRLFALFLIDSFARHAIPPRR